MQPSPIKVTVTGKDELSKVFKQIDKRTKRYASRFKHYGNKLSRGVSAPIAAVGGLSLKTAKDFNKGMGEIATLLPNNTKRVNELRNSILDMAVKTGMPIEDVRQATYGLLSAFGDSTDIVGKLETAMWTAKAGVASGADALDLLSGVALAYGDNSKEAVDNTADMAFTAMRLGKTTIPELAGAIKQATSYTAQFGAKQKTLFATMAHLAGVTGSTSDASTQLASVYGALLTPTEKMTKSVKMLGYESAAALGKGLDIDYLMKAIKIMSRGEKEVKKIAKSFGYASFVKMKAGLGEKEAIDKVSDATETSMESLGKLIARKEGQRAVLGATGKGLERYKKILKEVGDYEGALAQAKKDYIAGVGDGAFVWDQTVESMKRASIVVGDKLMPVMSKLFKQVSPLLDKISKMDDETLSSTLKWAGFAMALGPVLRITSDGIVTFGEMTKGIKLARRGIMTTSDSLGNLSTAMSNMTSKNLTNMGKLSRILQGTGMTLAAGAIGYGAGTLISKVFLEPHAVEKAKELSDLTERRHQIRREVLKKDSTLQEKAESLKELSQEGAKRALATTVENPLTYLAGTLSSIFADVESPMETMKAEFKDNATLQRDLLQKAIEQSKEMKMEIKVKNESNAELTVTKGTKMKKVPANTGRVMDGG